MGKQQQHLNESGTHAHVYHEQTEAYWECPLDYLEAAQKRGWVLTEPPVTEAEGLFDEATAEGENQTGFDPSEHTVDEVNAHLAEHAEDSPGEVQRVLSLEAAGKNRSTVKAPDPASDADNQ